MSSSKRRLLRVYFSPFFTHRRKQTNDMQRVLIVGGVAGGASCAARLRRLSEAAQIMMFERGNYVSFANVSSSRVERQLTWAAMRRNLCV